MCEKSVLIIDGDSGMLGLYAVILRRLGCTVLTAACADDALVIVQKGMPDLIITELMLPGNDAFDLCQRLRELCQLPILVVSTQDGPNKVRQAFEAGATEFLPKPFLPGALVALVNDYLPTCG